MSTLYNLKNIRALLVEGFTDKELRRLCHDVNDFRPVYHVLAENTGKDEIVDRLFEYANRTLKIELLLAWTKEQNPAKYHQWQPYLTLSSGNPIASSRINASTTPLHFFISYKQQVESDQKLAIYLYEILAAQGHEVFIDQTLRAGEAWLEEIDRQIKTSDFIFTFR